MPAELDVLYRLLVQSVTDYAVFMLDLDGKVSNWNAGAQRAKGYAADEIIGQHVSTFYQQEDRQNGMPAKALESALKDGSFESEGWRVRKDGSTYWARVAIDAVNNDAGDTIGFATITRDLTERMAEQKTANEQGRIFRLLVQGVTDYAIYTLDRNGIVSNWNPGAQRAKQYVESEIVGQHFSRFYTASDQQSGVPQRAIETALQTGKFEDYGWRVRRDGSRFWAHVVMEPIYDEAEGLIGFAKITQDLTESKKQLDELTRFKEMLDLALSNMTQALCLYDSDGKLILANPRFADFMGSSAHVCDLGSSFVDLLAVFHADDDSLFSPATLQDRQKRHSAMLGGREGQYREERSLQARRFVISHRALPAGGWVTTLDDVTERKRTEERIVHLAHHDSLTGLANRSYFTDVVRAMLSHEQECMLMYLDLDRFKPINDSLGHPVGDEVLRLVAGRIAHKLPAESLAARLGGDEFAILIRGAATVADATELADVLLNEISCPLQVKGFEVSVGSSIGIAFAPRNGAKADLLFRNADLALYAAKGSGRNRACFYEDAMEAVITERHSLEMDLRQALKAGQFHLVYQPVVDDEAQAVTSVEASLRWVHPSRGTLSPPSFIAVTEELGLMPEIGDWALQTACREAATWPDHIKIAVNLSIAQFRVPDLPERIAHILQASGLPPDRLELEITETAIIHDLESTSEVLQTLRAMGLKIALDDFGTGYSSLSFLRTLPFTRIKIDRSFTQDLGVTPGATAIIRAITGLCDSLGVATTAEGVETQEQRAILRAEGCRELQGYLFSKPVSASELRQWITLYSGVRMVRGNHNATEAVGLHHQPAAPLSTVLAG